MARFNKRSALGGLVLHRKEGERIVINHGEVVIEVVQVTGKQIRLAFRASKDVIIQRAEASDYEDDTPDKR
jgi:carbon storage regulator CsrA